MDFKSVHHSFKLTCHILRTTFSLLIFTPELYSITTAYDEYLALGGRYLIDFDEFPYAAKIQTVSTRDKNIQETICSAVVYRENWAITVSHCFEQSDLEAKNFKNYTIVSGWIYSVLKSQIEEVYLPDESEYPELFKGGVVEHDIALVKTTFPIARSHLQISLPQDMNSLDLRDETLYLYSFGATCSQPHRCPAITAKKVYITYLSKNICMNSSQTIIFDDDMCTWCPMDDSKICAKVQDLRGFTGPGDSGGPLVKCTDSTCVLIGILTQGGTSLDTYNKINVYSSIEYYKNFIVGTVRKNTNISEDIGTKNDFIKSLCITIYMFMCCVSGYLIGALRILLENFLREKGLILRPWIRYCIAFVFVLLLILLIAFNYLMFIDKMFLLLKAN